MASAGDDALCLSVIPRDDAQGPCTLPTPCAMNLSRPWGAVPRLAMRTVLLASLRTHTRRYVAAALAVIIGVAFVIGTARLTSAAREGLTSGVEAPYDGADIVLTAVDGTQADRLVTGAPGNGPEASVLGSTHSRLCGTKIE